MWTSAGVTTRTLPPPPLSPRHQSQPAHHPHCRCSWTGWAGGQCGPLPGCCFCNWCLHHHHLSSDQSGQGAARHGMQRNFAPHIIILPLLHQHDKEIIQLRSAGDFSCALRELRLLLLSPPASAGGELASKDTFPPAETADYNRRTCLFYQEARILLYSSAFII